MNQNITKSLWPLVMSLSLEAPSKLLSFKFATNLLGKFLEMFKA